MAHLSPAPVADTPAVVPRRAALVGLRALWVVLAVLIVAVVVAGTLMRYVEHLQVCTAPLVTCFIGQRLTPANLAATADPQAALRFHAAFFALVNTSTRGVCLALALLLFWRRPADWLALLVACYLLTVGNPGPLFTVAAAYPVVQPLTVLLQVLSTLSFGLFVCLFPGRRLLPRWSRWLALVWVVVAVTGPLMIFPAAAPVWFTMGVIAPLSGATVYLQLQRHRHAADPVERQQTMWILFGAALWFALTLLTRLSIPFSPPLDAPIAPLFYLQVLGFNLAILVWPICIGVAVLRFRLFDIDLIINRTLVYGGLTALVAGLYVLVVGGLGALLQARGSLALSLLATGLVAVLFQPLRDRLQRGVNRVLYGRRDEPYVALTQLGSRLETTADSDAILPTIVETVRETLKLPYVAITLLPHDGREVLQAAVGVAAGPPTTLPLVYQGTEIGQLRVSPRAGEAALSRADHGLLSALARHAGIAAYAVRLTGDLQHAREHLVVAREEERRRLRRDLHDGLGPSLATMTLQADTARGSLRADPEAADALLRELTSQSQTTMQEVRRLIHALRPPVLDDLGLVAALRAVGVSCSQGGVEITVEAPAALPPLPAAVEVAAYRITQEALTNVVKHAQARHCVVSLGCDAALQLRIGDDGRGIAADRTAGVGLASMRERAAELGGTYRIEPGASGGTVVSVALPLRGSHGPDPGADR